MVNDIIILENNLENNDNYLMECINKLFNTVKLLTVL